MDRHISDPVKKPTARVVSNSQPYRLLIANAKGGSGKTTITTNLATYLANAENGVAIIDHDPQGSSFQWGVKKNSSSRFKKLVNDLIFLSEPSFDGNAN